MLSSFIHLPAEFKVFFCCEVFHRLTLCSSIVCKTETWSSKNLMKLPHFLVDTTWVTLVAKLCLYSISTLKGQNYLWSSILEGGLDKAAPLSWVQSWLEWIHLEENMYFKVVASRLDVSSCCLAYFEGRQKPQLLGGGGVGDGPCEWTLKYVFWNFLLVIQMVLEYLPLSTNFFRSRSCPTGFLRWLQPGSIACLQIYERDKVKAIRITTAQVQNTDGVN